MGTEDIEAALQVVFMREGDKFESFCERLSPVQFKLLVGIARQGGREIQSRAFLDEVGIGNAASAPGFCARTGEGNRQYNWRDRHKILQRGSKAYKRTLAYNDTL